MKKVIRCKKCGERVLDYGVGFSKGIKLKCCYHNIDVDPDDGCTFGHEGDGQYIVKRETPVELANHEAVYGWDD